MTTDSPAQPGFLGRLFAPPTRLAALLPDGRFFLRLVPVEPEGDAASAAEQVALALETLAPFPLAQLYHGHFWQPGSPRALVYAVYRKRFPAEETVAWAEAQVVLPAFTSLLVDPPAIGTARVLMSSDAVTVFHWGDEALVPTHALIHPFAPEATEADRAAARDQLLRSLGPDVAVEDWDYPTLRRVSDGGEVTFMSGERELVVSADLAAALDVRDSAEIAERRSIQRRDILLWRVFLGMAALVLLCGVAEGAIMVGNHKLSAVKALVAANLSKENELKATEANTVEAERALGRRLYPLEMLASVVTGVLPPTITVNTTTASIDPKDNTAILLLSATATTTAEQGTPAREAQNFQSALLRLPENPKVVLASQATGGGGRGGGQNQQPVNGQPLTQSYDFTLRITFPPDSIQREVRSSAPAGPGPVSLQQ